MFAFFGIRGCRDITLRGRRVSPGTVQRATIIALTSFVFVLSACLALMSIEGYRGGLFTSENMIFEVVSAFGTVGLSSGLTPQLSMASRVVIMVVMFVGRVGLTSLVVALSSRAGQNNTCIRYPEERFMVG
jgi:trk system potassium uptake protein TrkH